MTFNADHKRALSTARLKVYDREEFDSIRNLARAYLELHMNKAKETTNANCAACKGDPYECAATPGRHCEAK